MATPGRVVDAFGDVVRHAINGTGLVNVLPNLTDMVPRGAVRPLGPDPADKVSVAPLAGAGAGALVVTPRDPPNQTVVFFHGFGHHVDEHLATTKVLAHEGQACVEMPALPGFKGWNGLGSHKEVCVAALKAHVAAAARAKDAGLPPPVVAGCSLRGGAALYVPSQRNVLAVLWAPLELDGDLPVTQAPLRVIKGGMDNLVANNPKAVASAQLHAARLELPGGTHTGFVNLGRFAWAEGDTRKTPLTRKAQRREAVDATLAFLDARLDAGTPPAPVMRRSDLSVPPSFCLPEWRVPLATQRLVSGGRGPMAGPPEGPC